MAVQKPRIHRKARTLLPEEKALSKANADKSALRIQELVSRRGSVREIGRQKIEIPKLDMIRELSRTPEGRQGLASLWKAMGRDNKEAMFEMLVKEFKDPTGRANLNIEGREILEALKGMPASPGRAQVQAEDAAMGVAPGWGKNDVVSQWTENPGTEPAQTSRFPRQPLPQGFDPKAKNISDPNSDLGTSGLSTQPGLRADNEVTWVDMPDGSRKPVISLDSNSQLSTVDYAQKNKQEGFDRNWDEQWSEWEQGGKEGAKPRRQKVQPLTDNKAKGSLTSPQELYDRRFMSVISGKKASNILTDTISKDDELFELYKMLVANPKKGYSISPNAVFSSPREMAEVMLRNVSPEILANSYNPASAREIKGLAGELYADNQMRRMEGLPDQTEPMAAAQLADKRGVPRGTKANQSYYADQILPALERMIEKRFGDKWGSAHTEVGVPDDIRNADAAPSSNPAGELSEGTTQDPSRIPGIADVAPRPESNWQGPLPEGDLTKNLASIDSAERGTRIMDRAEKAESDPPVPFGEQTYLGDRVVKPKTDLHAMMKAQLAEAQKPLEGNKRGPQGGEAGWSPGDLIPDRGRTKEIVQAKDASKRGVAAEKYNEFVDDSGKVNTRRSARDVAADLQAKLESGAEDAEIDALKEELRQAKILDSLVSPFGKKGTGEVGTKDGPVVSTKGRKGQAAEPDPFDERLQEELNDARIAAGLDPKPIVTRPPEAAPAPAKPATTDLDATPSDTIDPLESAATEIVDPEAPAKSPDNRKPEEPAKPVEEEAAAKVDEAKAPEDAESARVAEEADTIPEEAGSPETPKDKPSGRTWAGAVGQNLAWGAKKLAANTPAMAVGAFLAGGRDGFQGNSSQGIPVWGEDQGRLGMEQMPGVDGLGMDENLVPVSASPFRPEDNFSPMSPAERIRLMQKLNSIKPNMNTQTAQNWSR